MAELERLQAANAKAEQNLERELLIHGRTLAERTQQVLQATQQLGAADPIMLPPPMSYMPPPMAFMPPPPPPPPPAPREAASRGGRGGRGHGRGRGRGQADTYSRRASAAAEVVPSVAAEATTRGSVAWQGKSTP
jgi:hypothetical protein